MMRYKICGLIFLSSTNHFFSIGPICQWSQFLTLSSIFFARPLIGLATRDILDEVILNKTLWTGMREHGCVMPHSDSLAMLSSITLGVSNCPSPFFFFLTSLPPNFFDTPHKQMHLSSLRNLPPATNLFQHPNGWVLRENDFTLGLGDFWYFNLIDYFQLDFSQKIDWGVDHFHLFWGECIRTSTNMGRGLLNITRIGGGSSVLIEKAKMGGVSIFFIK